MARAQGAPRWAALLITFAVVLAVFAGIILIVIPVLIGQISQLATQIQGLVERIVNGSWNPVRRVQRVAARHLPALDVDKVFGYISDWYNSLDFGQIGSVAGNTILGIGAGIIAGFTGALIVLILTIYFAASTPNLKVAVAQLVRLQARALRRSRRPDHRRSATTSWAGDPRRHQRGAERDLPGRSSRRPSSRCSP